MALAAVQRAIADGRLTSASVGQDAKGRPVIHDPAQASREWAQYSRPRVDTRKGTGGAALLHATLRERRARAVGMELEIARKRGELVSARAVEFRWSALVVAARTTLLGVPSRCKVHLPHLTPADITVIDGLIREALMELAEAPVRHGRGGDISNTRPRAGSPTPAYHDVDHNGGSPTSPTRTVGESGDRP